MEESDIGIPKTCTVWVLNKIPTILEIAIKET